MYNEFHDIVKYFETNDMYDQIFERKKYLNT